MHIVVLQYLAVHAKYISHPSTSETVAYFAAKQVRIVEDLCYVIRVLHHCYTVRVLITLPKYGA
jgi:hypothetical protein